jgi:hypothetical protein
VAVAFRSDMRGRRHMAQGRIRGPPRGLACSLRFRWRLENGWTFGVTDPLVIDGYLVRSAERSPERLADRTGRVG